MSKKLKKPYTNEEKMSFIVQHNHNGEMRIEETETALYALQEWEKLDGDTVLSDKSTWNEEQEKAEKERIAKKGITKLDFYKLILAPNGIDYVQLNNILNSNIEYKAEWELCERVYRGNSTLIKAVKTFLPMVTDEMLDAIFMEYGENARNYNI